MNFLAALVLLLHGELVELTDDVIGGTGIALPVGVHSVGGGVCILLLLLLLFFFIVGVAVPAIPSFMSWLAADLAGDAVAVVLAAPALSTAALAAAATWTTMVAVATASTASAAMTTTRSATSTLGGVDGGVSTDAVAEELDAAVIDTDLPI
jgi:hypothetical protein